MNFLTPLYLLGALSIAAPVVFHLIRRTTRGEVPFGSLLFLAPSAPRITRRSRLDRWPLLLLRAAAFALLALAFARPFLREASIVDLGMTQRGRTVVLIDASASMRRGDLGAKARAAAIRAIGEAHPDDQLAILAFDTATRTLLGFEESAKLDPVRRRVVAEGLVNRVAPTWGGTDLGRALIDAADAIEDAGDAGRKAAQLTRRIILIGDMQQGAKLSALEAFEWPSDVALELRPVALAGSNAGLQRQAASAEGTPPGAGAVDFRVRIANDPAAKRDTFEVAWAIPGAVPVVAHVPPGESRVVRIRRAVGGRSLILKGDDQDFDNKLYVADEPADDATVLYLGPDAADDPAGLLYYLNRAFDGTSRRKVRVESRPALGIAPGPAPGLIVLAAEPTSADVEPLGRFVREGGTLLAVLRPGRSVALPALAGAAPVEIEEAPVSGDVILGEIAFDHPLFAPFNAPQFNDFTKIRFWKYRRIPAAFLGESRVLAQFEDGNPAVVEKGLGRGRLIVFASGWGPADGQLARSSKFVPLMSALLDGGAPALEGDANHLVHDSVPLPGGATSVRKPGGATARLALNTTAFAGTDEPGVYAVEATGGPRSFAVNLDPSESKTAPLAAETLEQLGCRLTSPTRDAAERDGLRQMQNAELEGRQKLWRWLILTGIGVLILETGVAGRSSRPVQPDPEALNR